MCTSSLFRDRSNPAYNIAGPPGAGSADNPRSHQRGPFHAIPSCKPSPGAWRRHRPRSSSVVTYVICMMVQPPAQDDDAVARGVQFGRAMQCGGWRRCSARAWSWRACCSCPWRRASRPRRPRLRASRAIPTAPPAAARRRRSPRVRIDTTTPANSQLTCLFRGTRLPLSTGGTCHFGNGDVPRRVLTADAAAREQQHQPHLLGRRLGQRQHRPLGHQDRRRHERRARHRHHLHDQRLQQRPQPGLGRHA